MMAITQLFIVQKLANPFVKPKAWYTRIKMPSIGMPQKVRVLLDLTTFSNHRSNMPSNLVDLDHRIQRLIKVIITVQAISFLQTLNQNDMWIRHLLLSENNKLTTTHRTSWMTPWLGNWTLTIMIFSKQWVSLAKVP